LLAKVASAYDEMTSYEAMVEFTVQDQVLLSIQRLRKAQMFRIDMLSPNEVAGQITLFDGRWLWLYDPVSNEAMKYERTPQEAFPEGGLFLEFLVEILLERPDCRWETDDWLDGHEAAVFWIPAAAHGDNGDPLSYRIWVSMSLALPIKAESYGEDDRVVYGICFRRLSLNPPLQDSLFAFHPPEGALVVFGGPGHQEMEPIPERMEEALGFPPYIPAYLPPGFTPNKALVTGCQDDRALVTEYSSGVRSFSITQSIQWDESLPQGSRRIAVDQVEMVLMEEDGPNKSLYWQKDGFAFLVAGDLPVQEMARVAASCRPYNSP